MVPPAHGDEAVGQLVELAGHQGEQVAGLGEGIAPARRSGGRPPARACSTRLPLASRRWKACGRSMRTVQRASTSGRSGNQVILRKPLGLALGAEAAARHVEPFERRVAGGVDGGPPSPAAKASQDPRMIRCSSVISNAPAPRARPVDGDADRLQPHPVQLQRRRVRAVAPRGSAWSGPGSRRDRGRRSGPPRRPGTAAGRGSPAGGSERADRCAWSRCRHGGPSVKGCSPATLHCVASSPADRQVSRRGGSPRTALRAGRRTTAEGLAPLRPGAGRGRAARGFGHRAQDGVGGAAEANDLVGASPSSRRRTRPVRGRCASAGGRGDQAGLHLDLVGIAVGYWAPGVRQPPQRRTGR